MPAEELSPGSLAAAETPQTFCSLYDPSSDTLAGSSVTDQDSSRTSSTKSRRLSSLLQELVLSRIVNKFHFNAKLGQKREKVSITVNIGRFYRPGLERSRTILSQINFMASKHADTFMNEITWIERLQRPS